MFFICILHIFHICVRFFPPLLYKSHPFTMPATAHTPDLIGRENRSLASQCIKTKIQCTPIVKKKKYDKNKIINNKRNNSIFSSLLGLQWAVNLLPWECCSLPEAERAQLPGRMLKTSHVCPLPHRQWDGCLIRAKISEAIYLLYWYARCLKIANLLARLAKLQWTPDEQCPLVTFQCQCLHFSVVHCES